MTLPTSRNRTYTPTDPVVSADLNDIQDQIIALKTGERVLSIHASAGSISGVPGTDGSFNDVGAWTADTSGDALIIPIPLIVGDQINSIRYTGNGGSTATKDISFKVLTLTTAGVVIQSTTTATSGAFDVTWDVTDHVLLADEVPFFIFESGFATDQFHAIQVTYTHPGA